MELTSKWSSRKWLSAWAVQILMTVLLCTGMIEGAEFIDGTKWLWGFYFASNVGTYMAGPKVSADQVIR